MSSDQPPNFLTKWQPDMLPFFPSPYPDELFYGICARYHQRSGHASVDHTLYDLFKNRMAAVSVELPIHIHSIIKNLHSRTLNTAEQLINAHTLLPLYRPFLPKARYAKILNRMLGGAVGGNIQMTIGATASGITSPVFLRYCPTCMSNDEQSYGEPYWHRSHQIPSVQLCHQHNEPLLDSTIISNWVERSRALINLSPEISSNQEKLQKIDNVQHDSWLAVATHRLLNISPPLLPLGLQDLHRRYLHYLYRRRLANVYGRLDIPELTQQFLTFYAEGFLAGHQCSINSDTTDNWLLALIHKPRKASHPLRHLLLIRFLGIDVESFFQDKISREKPFGRGPWPCLNPAAKHFRKPVIDNCTIGKNCETGAPTGTFSCKCGFVYSRSGPDRCSKDRYRSSRILSRGSLWEQTLLQLIEVQGKTLRGAARCLRVDAKTVIKHLHRLKRAVIPSKSQDDGITIDMRRIEWCSLATDNSLSSRKELRQLKPALYAWLYRHDRAWLLINPSLNQKPKRTFSLRVDWDVRDRHLANTVRLAVKELQQNLKHTITISRVGKIIGKLGLLQKHLDKLPETKSLLVALPAASEGLEA